MHLDHVQPMRHPVSEVPTPVVRVGDITFEKTTSVNSMKVLQVLALLIAGIALCNAVAIGNTGSTGATGGEASKAEEVKAEKAKKEEMEHTVASKRNEQMGNQSG